MGLRRFAVVLFSLSLAALAQEAKPPASPPPAAPPAASAQAPAPAAPKTEVIAQASEQPDSGRVLDDVYTSDFFGFSLTLPHAWTIEDRAALRQSVDEGYQRLYGNDPQQQAVRQEEESRAFLLLSAEGRLAGEPLTSQVQIGAEQLPADSGVETGKDYLDVVSAQTSVGGVELKPLHLAAEVKLDGHSFWRQDYAASATIAGKPVSIAYAEYVSVQKGYALIFSFWTDTPERLAALEKCVQTLRFAPPPPADTPSK